MPDRAAVPVGVDLDALTRLRRALHQAPELSGGEEATSGRIKAFLKTSAPDGLISGIGGFTLIIDHWLNITADQPPAEGSFT